MADIYVGSTKWTAVTAWAASTAYSVGALRRQLATPTVGNERVFRCTTAGTSGSSEPAWVLTAGATTNDGTVVWTEVTGLSTHGWNAAHARLANAFASGWGVAGDRFFVSNAHAETRSSAMTLTSPGTAASPCRIICVSDTVAPPTALATTATISTTGNSDITFAGFAWCRGVTFQAGTGTISNHTLGFVSTNPWWWRLESCTLKITASSGVSQIIVGPQDTGSDDQLLELVDCTLAMSATAANRILIRAPFRMVGGSITGPATSAVLDVFATGNCAQRIELFGVDLSAFGSGVNLTTMYEPNSTEYYLENCKLGSGVALTGGGASLGQGGGRARFVNCDSADTNYRYLRSMYQGTITHETVIVRTGGASDGTTALSRKMVTSANSKVYSPLESDPIIVWNETAGSPVTATVEVVTDGVTLTDAEAWLEVEYLGTSGRPLSSFAHDRVADVVLGTPANQATSSAAWTTTGLSSPVKQKLSVTFTPQELGPIRLRVMLAKPSTTMYADFKPTIA